ncbi:MAG: endonuclease domain-containing protein [Thermoanaerobaculia bacterium]
MRHQFVARARELRQTSTAPEHKIWRWLRNRYLGQYKFRRQHPVDDYILDFYCAELKLCIEVDGESHDYHVAYDARRTQFLEARGITVLRLRNEYIDEQPDNAWSLIVEAVENCVRQCRPSP